MVKKEPVIIEFESDIEQSKFLNWAVQKSPNTVELDLVKEIQRKVKAARKIQSRMFQETTEKYGVAPNYTSRQNHLSGLDKTVVASGGGFLKVKDLSGKTIVIKRSKSSRNSNAKKYRSHLNRSL